MIKMIKKHLIPKDLINNREFFGEYSDAEYEIRNYVAQELNISVNRVEVFKL